ncbi:MAG: NHLP leader peptide family RiPP precursor, partial [Chlamydiales bacterium]
QIMNKGDPQMTKTNHEKQKKIWAKIVAKAWGDEKFKARLLKNPKEVLKEMGLEFPSDQKIEIHQQSTKVAHLFLPKKPSGELTENVLKDVAAGRTDLYKMDGDTYRPTSRDT